MAGSILRKIGCVYFHANLEKCNLNLHLYSNTLQNIQVHVNLHSLILANISQQQPSVLPSESSRKHR